MSDNRHNQKIDVKSISLRPHRELPPTAEEIFGKKEFSDVELGMLQMQVLWFISHKPQHGYELMKTLNDIKKTKVGQGTLYPVLQKMEKQKLIKGVVDDTRVVYHITSEGKSVMEEGCADFSRTFFGIFQDFVCKQCLH
ncbi:MAG: PadR family transcriptional regulator [Candidatus Aenigmarchaeota archaeon]|nr:PadR family transcriptional regulator [Candidatus Aenigmarchaeota archaeon]